MKEVFTSETFQTLSARIEDFMEDHGIYDYTNVTIVIEKIPEDDAAFGSYHWKATLMLKDTADAMSELLVEEHGYLDIFWSEDDILGRVSELYKNGEIPSKTLDKRQMLDIKEELSITHNAEVGLSWEFIDFAIKNVFDDDSDPDEACERDRERHGTDGYENDMDDWTDVEMIGF